jgi:serine phosphatase RsbU (regulator of sigma subunit)
MKLKITHPWIPFWSILLFVLFFFLGFIAKVEALFYVSAATGLFMVLIYSPLIAFKAYKGQLEEPKRLITYIGASAILLIVIASFGKLYSFPGASLAVIVGGFFFYACFLPVWYCFQHRLLDVLGRVLYFVFGTSAGLLIVSWQFKFMHWPGADALFGVVRYLVLFSLVPLGIYALIFRNRQGYVRLTQGYLFGFMCAFVLASWLSSNLTRKAFANEDTNQMIFEQNKNLYESKCKYLYDAMQDTITVAHSASHYKQNIAQLKKLSAEVVNYIQQLKAVLIERTDDLAYPLNPDSVRFEKMVNKANYDVPTAVLGVMDGGAKDSAYSAKELKRKITMYVEKVEQMLPPESVVAYKQANPFDFSNVEREDAQMETWEKYHFYHQSLSMVYQTLTNFQANIRFIEMTALSELFNKATASNKGNVAAQLADLALKYESEKKEKEIMSLQKDKEMNDMKLQAKDAEISNREKTITYFVIALIAFAVLTVFIIRSNLLRKQANIALAQQKKEVEQQKHLVDEKQKEITDSINYAKRLQQAILPPLTFISEHCPDSFVMYKPKDIVAGDFYWAEQVGDLFFIAAADCTGHGVPGAMVSVVCRNALNQTVKELAITGTGKILDKTRELVVATFEKSHAEIKDGMDISLLCIDQRQHKVRWSGANNPLWYVADNSLIEIKADKQPVGKSYDAAPFTTIELSYQPGTIFYLFTDGFADQFGGPKGKKFKYKQFEETLLSLSLLPMHEQLAQMESRFEEWKGSLEQVDDVCVIGIRL